MFIDRNVIDDADGGAAPTVFADEDDRRVVERETRGIRAARQVLRLRRPGGAAVLCRSAAADFLLRRLLDLLVRARRCDSGQ